MPLDPAFLADCPYGPGGLLIDEVLSLDHARGVTAAAPAGSPSRPA
jgi:hypothetical protein